MKLRLLFLSILMASGLAGFAQITSVGLIGTAWSGGWGSDTNLVQNPDSAHLWSLDLPLTASECKFRANDDWATNWGAPDFPIGTGLQNGSNIPVPQAGIFTVKFNSNTGAYNFSVHSNIGIIGDATPGGWGDDTNMFQNPTDTDQYTITLSLKIGSCKFRLNDSWTTNWGSTAFPSGTGVQNGDNIPIAAAGKYKIDFNKLTGAYNFSEIIAFTAISLTGDGTQGGWSVDTNLTKDAGNPDLWKGTFTLLDGSVKFRANHGWAISWGDTTFPSGIGKLGGPNIPTKAGDYLVNFNVKTGAYNFLKIGNYTSVGIIGEGTPQGWSDDTPMMQDANDKSKWRLRLKIEQTGLDTLQVKFRANHDWAVNWGVTSGATNTFPTGIGEQDGNNIRVPKGEYVVDFNSTTREYHFEILHIYDTLGIIGPATPNGNWNDDVYMTKSATDESFWVIPTIDISTGECKFRVKHDWAINWGDPAFPTGIGTQDGKNIKTLAGTYRVTLNSATGEYAFGAPGAAVDLLQSNAIKFSPNPAFDVVNIQIDAPEMTGNVQANVFDALGQQVLSQKMVIENKAALNVSSLKSGQYLVQLSNGKYMVAKQLVVVK